MVHDRDLASDIYRIPLLKQRPSKQMIAPKLVVWPRRKVNAEAPRRIVGHPSAILGPVVAFWREWFSQLGLYSDEPQTATRHLVFDERIEGRTVIQVLGSWCRRPLKAYPPNLANVISPEQPRESCCQSTVQSQFPKRLKHMG